MRSTQNPHLLALAAVPVGAPMTTAMVKGPAVLPAGPVGVFTLAAKKGRPAGGWGRAAVPAGVPAAATVPTTHSREAATTA
jgi:hypothetical protein